MSKNQLEFKFQKLVCKWLALQHPNILFFSDTIASVRLTIPQSIRNKQIQKQGFKTPDLMLLEPNQKYHGLFIELKIKSPFKKNGELFKNEHLEEQQQTIKDLLNKGYYACFVWDFEQVQDIVNRYLKNEI